MSDAVPLAPVDDALLPALREVAVRDASANEVTPPLTAGDAWTPERIAWFDDYHRACAAGLSGPRGEATWAVLRRGVPVGAVRLRALPDAHEIGIWLARSARGRGVSSSAARLLLEEARRASVGELRADTAETNAAARALLAGLGFETDAPREGRVAARLRLDPTGVTRP